MAEICEAITLKVVVPLPIILTVDFRGEFLSSSDGEDYKRGYEEGHAQGLIDGQKDGYQSGYDEGYKVGSESGYQTGKQDGLIEGYDNGYAQGKADGYKDGYDEGYQIGYSEGYEEGKAEGDSYYDTFWDSFQQNGERTNYDCAFYGVGWTSDNFHPKYDIVANVGSSLFYKASNLQIDLGQRLAECGVELVLTSATATMNMFNGSGFTSLPEIALNKTNMLVSIFRDCTNLHTIEKLVVTSDKTYSNTFNNCTALENLTIEGEIGHTFDIKSSPLTVESAKSIITHLVNYAGTENEYVNSVNFNTDVWARLDALGNDSPNGNTWREYINDLGWNAS